MSGRRLFTLTALVALLLWLAAWCLIPVPPHREGLLPTLTPTRAVTVLPTTFVFVTRTPTVGPSVTPRESVLAPTRTPAPPTPTFTPIPTRTPTPIRTPIQRG